jgi:hypothetical protein
VGQKSRLQPAVVETQSGVSGGVGRFRQMPVCPTLAVVFCRQLSPCVGGHWGRYWGSRSFRGRSSPCCESPIRGRNHLRYGLIRRLFLDSLFVASFEPLAHCPLGHPRRSGDVLLLPTLLLQLPGASLPSFAPVQLGLPRAHSSSIVSV